MYDGREIKDADLEIVEIPAHTFAVFTCRGKMPEAFNQVYKKIGEIVNCCGLKFESA